jgi:hypothetical protein
MTVAPHFELRLPAPGRPLVYVGMTFGADGREVWPEHMPVGYADRTVPQLEAAADRLGRGEMALWRVAVDDVEHGQFIRFTPRGDDAVDVDCFFLSRAPEAHYYPVSSKQGEAEQLYARVEAGVDDPEPEGADWASYTWELPGLDREATIAALRREARRARERLAQDGREPAVR